MEKQLVKVLLVEDNSLNQMLMNLHLGNFGFEITTVADGREAIEKVTTEHFDLIFMDIRMPNVNGCDATKYIRENGVTTPIIAMTADVADGGEQRCFDAGCDAFLAKPIIRKELYDLLDQYLDCEIVFSNKSCTPSTLWPL